MEPYNASLRGLFHEQLHGVVGDVACTSIVMHERQRKIDRKTVGELSESIEKTGLLQPIGVRRANEGEDGTYHLLFGAHRLTAWLEKFEAARSADDQEGMARWHSVPAVVFNHDQAMTPDMMLLLELSENVHRKDLSPGERKVATAQVGELLLGVEKQKGTKKKQGTKVPLVPTMKVAAEQSNIPYRTFQKWYRAYREGNGGVPIWSKQEERHYKAWLNHLKTEAQREQEAAEQAERDKENSRKETALKAIHKAVSAYVGLFGSDGVLACVKAAINEAEI